MGLFGLIKKQFVNVIEWTEEENGIISFRFPLKDEEIQNGAQLTVRDTQVVLFVNEGQLADIFEPGRHILTTNTLPVLTSIKNWDKGFKSPFKSDIYFFSIRDQLNQRWGTSNPISVRDKEFGPIGLRAHGTYSYKLRNPKTFYKKISGTTDKYSTEDLEGQLRSTILTSLASYFGSTSISFVDMAGNQTKFSETLKGILSPGFSDYGLDLKTFYVQSLNLPEEIQSRIDKMGSEEDPTDKLTKLHDLLQKGVITQSEFDQKKSELLKKI